jgi:glycerol-3-phosphate dehydrogenase (NAD(P)+)
MISSMSRPDFEDILKSQEITEGYYTVKAVKQITDEKKIDMPIMQSVYNILYNSHSIKDEIKNLLERPITDEFKK